jgi:hypothetical protein
MTSLGALLNWLNAGRALSGTRSRGPEGDCRLRPIPKEEIFVYVKAIDNARMARVVDKKDWAASAGVAGSVIVASLLLIALLLPGGVNLLASHRMEGLKRERAQLVNELRQLRSKEASLKSPDKLLEYAGDRFVTPAATAVVFAAPATGTAVAALGRR